MISYPGYWKSVPRSRCRFVFGKVVSPKIMLNRSRIPIIPNPPFALFSFTINGLLGNIARFIKYLQVELASGFYLFEEIIVECKGKKDWIYEHQP
jgi:hypothetical protein